ncbi:hypothetical protein [Mesorhizobium waimense]|nr:hypothetical protein [Mesorhizobium waimense]
MPYGSYREDHTPRRVSARGDGNGGGIGWDRAIAIANGEASNFKPYATADGFMWAFVDDGTDPADRLPKPARAKLLRLRDERTAAHDLVQPMFDRINDSHIDKLKAFHEIQKLESEYNRNIHFASDERAGREPTSSAKAFLARIDETKRKHARLTEIHNRLVEQQSEKSGRSRALAGLLDSNLERWLKALPPGSKIIPYQGAAPKLRKGETTVEAIERVRQERAVALADLNDLRARPITVAAAKAKAKEQIERLAADGRPSVLSLLDHGEQVRFALSLEPRSQSNISRDLFAALAFTTWVNRDALIAAINKEIDAVADGTGISDNDRASAEAELTARLHGLERDEEALIDQAELSGTRIDRRTDADAQAVLGIQIS